MTARETAARAIVDRLCGGGYKGAYDPVSAERDADAVLAALGIPPDLSVEAIRAAFEIAHWWAGPGHGPMPRGGSQDLLDELREWEPT